MKTLTHLSVLCACLLLAIGCAKTTAGPDAGGIPLVPTVCYDLIDDASGQAWFARSGATSPDSVQFQVTGQDGIVRISPAKILRVRGKVWLQDDPSFMGQAQPVNSPAYINNVLVHLNRRDTDTLRLERYPKGYRNDLELEELRCYYNGRLSASFDFRANPNLRDSLFERSRFGLVVPLRKVTAR
ncbi:hypothetical protein MUN81_11215 [Hymenobacter sp. 5317J-9]|uniref:hypothetical protein n=1 Tax=Hymenobacter sp. 5317J-9 TaxID=2932250 RepID=UPI001FD6B630|nr:hypothetical protein [Hymenobacter sp. 5317J-9]UOQ95834.1 hypothetical protein MUN81_11215 [Hymenobacter sp. 5317J-9]